VKPQPFLDPYPINSSWSIASTLPSRLPATNTCPAIQIVKHPEPIKVAYRTVIDLLPRLVQHDSNPDIILYLGLAAGRTYYTLERRAPRGPYSQKRDVDGAVFHDSTGRWSDCPPSLQPTFDTDDVFRRWRRHIVGLAHAVDARLSDDPGNFLCGFIYYASLAWFWKRGAEERPVMFLHVPDCPTEERIEYGRKVAVGLIRALVESRESLGVRDPLKKNEP